MNYPDLQNQQKPASTLYSALAGSHEKQQKHYHWHVILFSFKRTSILMSVRQNLPFSCSCSKVSFNFIFRKVILSSQSINLVVGCTSNGKKSCLLGKAVIRQLFLSDFSSACSFLRKNGSSAYLRMHSSSLISLSDPTFISRSSRSWFVDMLDLSRLAKEVPVEQRRVVSSEGRRSSSMLVRENLDEILSLKEVGSVDCEVLWMDSRLSRGTI